MARYAPLPRLDSLLYQNPFGTHPDFVLDFVKVHDGDWDPAQTHWERCIAMVLRTDAVARHADGVRALEQAVPATIRLLSKMLEHDRCPLCTSTIRRGGRR